MCQIQTVSLYICRMSASIAKMLVCMREGVHSQRQSENYTTVPLLIHVQCIRNSYKTPYLLIIYKSKPASCKLLTSKSTFPQMVQAALYGLGVNMTVDCGIQWTIPTKPVPVRQQLMPLHKMLIIILLLISAAPRGSEKLVIIVISVWLPRGLQRMPLPGVV